MADIRQYIRDLSGELHCSYRTLFRVLKLPGAPQANAEGKYDLEEVRAFVTDNSQPSPDKEVVKDRKLKAQTRLTEASAELKEIELAVAKKEVADIAEWNQALGGLGARIRSILARQLLTQADRYRGMDALACKTYNQSLYDEICAEMRPVLGDGAAVAEGLAVGHG